MLVRLTADNISLLDLGFGPQWTVDLIFSSCPAVCIWLWMSAGLRFQRWEVALVQRKGMFRMAWRVTLDLLWDGGVKSPPRMYVFKPYFLLIVC